MSYEDPESIAAKCRFVLAQKLGGVMFWEYTNDPSGALLGAINDALHPAPEKADETMSTAQHGSRAATPAALSTSATRVVSIDIFRGLTIAVMIFVNELAEVRGLPWWTYHAHATQDVMTYVDMVFPFFLFIVGMSMPLSVEQRLKRDASVARLWLHVLVRSLSLLVLGLILANSDKVDRVRTGMRGDAWGLLGLISAGLYLNVYPRQGWIARHRWWFRGAGLAGVAVAFAIFRRAPDVDGGPWIDFSYPENSGADRVCIFCGGVALHSYAAVAMGGAGMAGSSGGAERVVDGAAGSFSQPPFAVCVAVRKRVACGAGDGGRGDGADLLWCEAGD